MLKLANQAIQVIERYEQSKLQCIYTQTRTGVPIRLVTIGTVHIFVGSNSFESMTQADSGNHIWLCGTVAVLDGGSVWSGLRMARLDGLTPV
jgi:hypothetical protein